MIRAASITGVGIVSALGTGRQAHLDAMLAGRDGLRPVHRFDTTGFSSQIAGTWPAWDSRKQREASENIDPSDDFSLFDIALVAAREALSCAAMTAPKRTALILGTCFGKGFREFHSITERLARELGIEGPCFTLSTACASSTNAIGLARDLLYRGEADVVLAGGADVLLQEVFAGFSSLGVLSAQRCAPFSEPHGTNLAEGAGFLVVERPADAAVRGALIYGSVHGYGLSSDGYHETTPDPSGAGIARAIRGALADAQWSREQVDFVSAHATGTTTNDRIEWTAIQREVGSTAPLCGSKSQVGHAQGAAGVIELILALLAMSQQKVPATLHFQGPRAGCPADPMAGDVPRSLPVERALKLSSAFGGANASLAFCGPKTFSVPVMDEPVKSRVIIRGMGIVGEQIDALLGENRPGRDVLPVDPRRLDRSSRLLVAAANAAFASSGVALPKGAARERAGIFIGAPHMPEESSNRCRESMRENGVARASAMSFARMSVNSPTGACARLFGLLGPSSTLSIGEGSGLAALVLATDWLATRRDADMLVAGSVDEPMQRAPRVTEAAACVVLTQEEKIADGQIEAVSWFIAGIKEGQARVKALRERQDIAIFSDGFVEGERVLDVSQKYHSEGATRSLVALHAALRALRNGELPAALVLNVRSNSTICALLLQRS